RRRVQLRRPSSERPQSIWRGAVMRVHLLLKLATASLTGMLVASAALAGEQDFAGNYQLISATRIILDTEQIEDTFGKKPKGLAMEGTDGHFIILITYDG